MIRRLETFRGILPGVLGLLLATCGVGCNAAQRGASADLAPPIATSPDTALAGRWYLAWEEQSDVLGGGEVRDMFFVLGSRGRNWREPDGPDGYPVRVSLLDGLARPIRAEGTLLAFLVHAPLDAYRKKALHAWSISPQQTEKCFREDRIPGYLLRLDWGENPPSESGIFMLVIRWSSKDGTRRITRNLVFNDGMEHAITTTSRPKQR